MSAYTLVDEMLVVLKSRGGFDWWWDEIDADIQEEIIDELYEVSRRGNMRIYVLHGKHGEVYARSPLTLLRFQVGEGWYVYDTDEVWNEASRIVDSGDEKAAWEFLQMRSDWEYERVSIEEVLD